MNHNVVQPFVAVQAALWIIILFIIILYYKS